MTYKNQPQKILVVDDEKLYANSLGKRISLRGYQVEIAYDGESALTMLQNDPVGIMILDLRLPDIQGDEILRRVKEKYPHIQVIIVTGHGSDKDYKKCMELGAHAFMHKPIHFLELIHILNEIEDKPQ